MWVYVTWNKSYLFDLDFIWTPALLDTNYLSLELVWVSFYIQNSKTFFGQTQKLNHSYPSSIWQNSAAKQMPFLFRDHDRETFDSRHSAIIKWEKDSGAVSRVVVSVSGGVSVQNLLFLGVERCSVNPISSFITSQNLWASIFPGPFTCLSCLLAIHFPLLSQVGCQWCISQALNNFT